MTTTKILTGLLITAALSCSVVFAQDSLRASMENGLQRVESALHGKTSCVMVDNKIYCAPAAIRAPIKMASAVTN